MPDKVIIPIKRTSIYAGLATLSGVLKLNEKGVEVEYQKTDEIIRAYKSDPESISLPFKDIEKAEVKKGWFSHKIYISLSSLKHAGKFPGMDGYRIKLKIPKKELEKAQTFRSSLMLAVSEEKLRLLDEEEFRPEQVSLPEATDESQTERHGGNSSRLKNMLKPGD